MRLLNFLTQDLDPYLVDLISVGPQMPQKVVIWRELSTKLTKLQSFAAWVRGHDGPGSHPQSGPKLSGTWPRSLATIQGNCEVPVLESLKACTIEGKSFLGPQALVTSWNESCHQFYEGGLMVLPA